MTRGIVYLYTMEKKPLLPKQVIKGMTPAVLEKYEKKYRKTFERNARAMEWVRHTTYYVLHNGIGI